MIGFAEGYDAESQAKVLLKRVTITPIKVCVLPIDFEKGSTLHIVRLERRDVASFIGLDARFSANIFARQLERALYDELDEERRLLGQVKVSRPNV
jgi:hypothetical protein